MFTKFAQFVPRFRMNLLKRLRSCGGFKLRGLVPPNFQRPLAAKLCMRAQTASRCKNVLEVLYHHAKFGGARISPVAGVAKNVESFCLFVTFRVSRRRREMYCGHARLHVCVCVSVCVSVCLRLHAYTIARTRM